MSASASRTTSISPTGTWQRATASWSPPPSSWSSCRAAVLRASTRQSSYSGPQVATTDLPGARGTLGSELIAAIELARIAGVEVLKFRGGDLGIELKPGDEPVTLADKRASDIIVAGLQERFPAIPVISEE